MTAILFILAFLLSSALFDLAIMLYDSWKARAPGKRSRQMQDDNGLAQHWLRQEKRKNGAGQPHRSPGSISPRLHLVAEGRELRKGI